MYTYICTCCVIRPNREVKYMSSLHGRVSSSLFSLLSLGAQHFYLNVAYNNNSEHIAFSLQHRDSRDYGTTMGIIEYGVGFSHSLVVPAVGTTNYYYRDSSNVRYMCLPTCTYLSVPCGRTAVQQLL